MKNIFIFFVLLNISIAFGMSKKVENPKIEKEQPKQSIPEKNINVIFKAIKPEFLKGENVCFYLENKTNKELLMPSSAPWAILENEKVIYSPIALQVITIVKPNEKKQWCWNQKDVEGKDIASGDYIIRITFFDKEGEKYILSTPIKIKVK
ncbi:hypothetical protein JCM14244_15420 [Venenivibrio stagnispumantis]|uniref:Uncharacterized protein n=1 Tax=Venenivibrio stagnispumantis TaxID=407998 RepID=A0AA45WJ82_9AQUI|nr:hypothetical protein [Venenivibrio stagnispumantis]MCW4572478.1 hypothetical protein [Venenivibrio stagnispumantis]SMP02391.1 hypothetical protein SAMN06264868_10275 [Venenivibrio stagnispumantis]